MGFDKLKLWLLYCFNLFFIIWWCVFMKLEVWGGGNIDVVDMEGYRNSWDLEESDNEEGSVDELLWWLWFWEGNLWFFNCVNDKLELGF